MSVECMSLAWSADGQNLYAGFTDNLIRVYSVEAMWLFADNNDSIVCAHVLLLFYLKTDLQINLL